MITRFPCLSLEGGLIAADLIDQIAEGKAMGQRPADFGFEGKFHLTDEIAAVWTEARANWDVFQHRLERLPADDPATSVTRDQWMIPFLSLLKYELLYTPRAATVDGQTYALSHRGGTDENAPPVHIVGCRQSLDKRPESGRPRLAPHSLLQEYLNRTEHLWALVTNGYTLRLLRDSHLIRRQSYIEFDLKQMMEGEKFADFALLYRLSHRSRLPKGIEDVSECLLEQYHNLTVEQGGRVREHLRDGVEKALKILGNGLLNHFKNENLLQKVRENQVTPLQFYQELLRLIYRFLFLMVAEERNLITENTIYRDHYSISRLRRLAEQRSAYSDHEDLWQGLQTTYRLFQEEKIGEKLGVPPLNGSLFDSSQTPDLEKTYLSNRDLLSALRHLSLYREDNNTPLRRINYSALDVEELGSVYESLLEFQPVFQSSGVKSSFELSYGTERKSTGSYYTPPELVNELIKSALVPVLEERLNSAKSLEEKEQAILKLTVCDPACGSGHFLLAATRQIGRELAKIRTGDDEPAPEQNRLAVRDVITHCIYGVDKNPLAVDLCKVALWIEGHARGKPLTFLDHRIRCGDSLTGVLDLKFLQEGIPDEAFDPVAGDDRAIARSLKGQNRDERAGLRKLPFTSKTEIEGLANARRMLFELSDDTPDQIQEKARAYRSIQNEGTKWWNDNTACHLWTSAFFVELTPENQQKFRIPTTDALHSFMETRVLDGRLAGYSGSLAQHYRFFHWPLEFPEVFASGGFDVILSNPPFVGGQKISGTFGDKYRHYLSTLYEPFKGRADLCAAFYRRAFNLLIQNGLLGMVATNTIAQGDTRESGLAVIVRNGGAITFALRFVKWPVGSATVEVNIIAASKNSLNAQYMLDGQAVEFISSRLDNEPEAEVKSLLQNKAKSFQGDIIRGIGFVVKPEEAEHLITKDPKNSECLFPYLTGEDLNSHPEQEPSRFVICFHNWSLDKAKEYPNLLSIVSERVKPEREKVKEKRERENWWLFTRYRGELRHAIAPINRILVRSRVSELHMLTAVPKKYICSDRLVVFAFDDDYHFALLQSNVHELWLRKYGFTLRTDMCYAPEDSFDTFPFPQCPLTESRMRAAQIGAAYYKHRRQVMLSRKSGLTPSYNLFHNPTCTDADIARLRELHAEMDRAILACYRWDDLDPQHGFYQNERGLMRYTVSTQARREILRKLLDLNLKIAEEERGR